MILPQVPNGWWRHLWYRLRYASPALAKYRKEAQTWTRAGEPTPERDTTAVAVTHWWMADCARAGRVVPPAVRVWQVASEAPLARSRRDWLEQYLHTRVFCQCGQRWRVESAAFCTHCHEVVAPCCVERQRLPRWRCGSEVCPYCHRGEVVG